MDLGSQGIKAEANPWNKPWHWFGELLIGLRLRESVARPDFHRSTRNQFFLTTFIGLPSRFSTLEKPIAEDHFRAEGEQLPRVSSTRVSSDCKGNDGKNSITVRTGVKK